MPCFSAISAVLSFYFSKISSDPKMAPLGQSLAQYMLENFWWISKIYFIKKNWGNRIKGNLKNWKEFEN